VTQVQPAAVLAAIAGADAEEFAALAHQIGARKPYLPLIAVAPEHALPDNAIPFSPHGGKFDRLLPRLRTALRIRTLNIAVLRRLDGQRPCGPGRRRLEWAASRLGQTAPRPTSGRPYLPDHPKHAIEVKRRRSPTNVME